MTEDPTGRVGRNTSGRKMARENQFKPPMFLPAIFLPSRRPVDDKFPSAGYMKLNASDLLACKAERLEAAANHAGQTAFACIESRALERNRLHEVYQVDIDTLELTGQPDGQQHWRYAGRAHSQGRLVLQRWKQQTPVTGTIQLMRLGELWLRLRWLRRNG